MRGIENNTLYKLQNNKQIMFIFQSDCYFQHHLQDIHQTMSKLLKIFSFFFEKTS